ncbi:DUF1972 domain-containing protein [Cellulomonas rhizosphaerae]|uniref:DUF1972 domain-containing protein n=2 Tax=Cellulomonas rhizosphaerae TaxID=2293719 RepID=A0A413RNH7_9CELL|nr:DUF1972 domain-containing protein [Cellulomonas rhizosphaerae]
MVGTRGVPARYGGFETAVEEVGRRLVDYGHHIRVYCRSGNAENAREYLGMELVTLPALRSRTLETLSHTGISAAHLVLHRTDVAFMFNAANAPWLPLLRAARVPVATHVDGLEWRRSKWGPTGRRYYRAAETASVRLSDALIADAQGISDYYTSEFNAPTTLLTYGAPIIAEADLRKLREVGVHPRGYHLVVARFEPENHVELIVEGYVKSKATLPLLVVGSAPYADEYTAKISALSDGDPRVRLLGGVWDQDLLDALYAGSMTYLHGHSVGGTNPSLLRAIGAAAPAIAFDVTFNREVLGVDGVFFAAPSDVARLVERAESDPDGEVFRGKRLQGRAGDYDWDVVARGYEQLALDLAARRAAGPVRRARRLDAGVTVS